MKKHSICIIVCIALVLCFFGDALAVTGYINRKTKVYKYPSKSSQAVTVSKGVKVNVVAYKNGWCKIKRGGRTAYIPSKYLSHSKESESKINKVLKLAANQVGKRYGRNPPKKFDCSALVQYCFSKYGYSMKGTAHAIARDNRYAKVSVNNLKKGDIICIDSNGDKRCDHVAIYIGRGYMIEASFTAQRVRVKKMTSWYKSHTMWARRVA